MVTPEEYEADGKRREREAKLESQDINKLLEESRKRGKKLNEQIKKQLQNPLF